VVDRLAGGEGSMVELVGEPGIGKTALLDAVCRRAEERGCLVLRGRAARLERDVPFQVIVDALDDHLGSVKPRLFESLDRDARVELGRVFPGLSALALERRPALDSERYRAHLAVRSLLALLARRRPLVLALDDVHWTDGASRELLSLLVRRPSGGPVLLALAYRRGLAPEALVEVMDAAVVDGVCERLEVGPLERGEVDELLGPALPDPAVRARVFQDTGGNPFYIRQLSAHPRAIARLPIAGSDGDGIPESVLLSIRGELATLGEETRVVLQGAAVAGDPFEPGLAAAGADRPSGVTLGCLDELLERELVRRGDSPRRFQFRHPIVWRAIYEAAPAGWRIGAHARIAACLRARRSAPAAQAPHLEAAARPGDENAIAILTEAAHSVASRAPASTAKWLGSALQLLPSGEDHAERRIALLVPMALALDAAGHVEQSRDALREVLDLIPPDARSARAKAAAGCATMEFLLRRKDAGERLLLHTLASLGEDNSAEAAEITFALGWINSVDAEHEDARAWCRRALAISEQQGLHTLQAAATGLLAYGEGRLGNVAASTTLLRRAVEIVDRLPDTEVGQRVDALFWLVPTEVSLERFDAAVRHADRGLAIARATGQGRWLPQFSVIRLFALIYGGHIAEAVRVCDDVVEMARLTGDIQSQTLALGAATEAMRLSGDLRQALVAGERAIQRAGPPTGEAQDFAFVVAHAHVARCRLDGGQPNAFRQQYLECSGGDALPWIDAPWRAHGYHDLTLADVALGDLEGAERWAARAEATAEQLGLPGGRGWAGAARATVMLARGHAARAAQIALEAADAHNTANTRLDEGRTRTLAGRALGAAGQKDAAIAQLQRAVEMLADCGAIRLRDDAARELRKLGRRAQRHGRRGKSGTVALSPRQREIADLVVVGKTNKQIAAELHLSPHTVENHLRHIFAKLGVSRRAAVAAKLAND
jgi:DNA-binding CsgD family transcriptional regulator/tetratricopeptide (TPR) repeat protein